MATTLDPNNKSSTEALSGGNLVATSSGLGTVAATRVLTSVNSYFEVAVTTLTGVISIGLVNRGYNMASGTILGTDANGVGFKSSGTVVINNATVATIFTFAQGDTIGVAVDLARQLIWFTKNGTTWNNDVIGNQNPVGDVGGISLSTMTLGSALPACGGSLTGAVLTAAFSGFTYTPPTGYNSVDTSGATATNCDVPRAASYATIGGTTNHAVTPIAARASWLGPGQSNAPRGGQFSPGGVTHAAGNVKEGASSVSGKTVRVYDTNSGEFLGSGLSDGSGNFSIPALGRTQVDVVAKDPTIYQAEIYDRVTPV